MIVKTSTGFTADVNEKKVNDYRFLECTVQAMKGDGDFEKLQGYMGMIKFLFSKEDKEKLLDHVAESNEGICDVESLGKEFQEILEALKEKKEVKNS